MKGFTFFIFLMSTMCLFFFMNCANEEPIIIEGTDIGSQSTPTTLANGNIPFPALPTPTPPPGQGTNNCPTPPQVQSSIIQQIAAKTGDLYKTDTAQFTQNVAECLKDIDANWGRRLDTVGSLANDIIAYYMGENTDPYSVDMIDSSIPSSPQLVWSVQGTSTQCGQVGGTWQSVTGDCILDEEEEEEEEEQCTQNQLTNGYATINGQCLKKCDTFRSTNASGVIIGQGVRCDDTANYNILTISNTYESQLDTPQTCCRMSSRRSCPSGYRSADGNCEPTCAHAVTLKGYTEHHVYSNGPGHRSLKGTTDDCPDNSHAGHTDWQNFDFYDPYRFVQIESAYNNSLIYEVQPNSQKYGCCVRGEQTGTAIQSYDASGWHPDDYTTD